MNPNDFIPYNSFEEEHRACPNKGYGFTQKHFEQIGGQQHCRRINRGDVIAGYHRQLDEFLVFLILGMPDIMASLDPENQPEEDFEMEIYQTMAFSPYHYPSHQYELYLPDMKHFPTISVDDLLTMSAEYIRERTLVVDRLRDLLFVDYAYELRRSCNLEQPAPAHLQEWTGSADDSQACHLHWENMNRRLHAFTKLDKS